MIECLISFLIACLVAVVVLWVIEKGLGAVAGTPPGLSVLLRCLVALILLLKALPCLEALR